jgi:hypothetical protein
MADKAFTALGVKIASGKYKDVDRPLEESLRNLIDLIKCENIQTGDKLSKSEEYRQRYYNLTGLDPLSPEFAALEDEIIKSLENRTRS